MSAKDNYTGTGVAMITPFDANGSVDFKQLEAHTDFLIKNGIDYLVVLGTTAETPVLSKDEKVEIIDTVQKANSKRVPIVVGAGGNNTEEVIQWIKYIGNSRADALLSVVPYYNKPTQTGIVQHFSAIATSTDLPVILYNVPGRTGANMSADTTIELATEHASTIVAIKEASGDFSQIMKILSQKPEDFKVISGDDAITLPMISLGAKGVISVIGNALPEIFSKMVNLSLQGKFDIARELHYKLLPFVDKVFQEGNPTGVKALMEILGLGTSNLRLPLVPASRKLTSDLEELAKGL